MVSATVMVVRKSRGCLEFKSRIVGSFERHVSSAPHEISSTTASRVEAVSLSGMGFPGGRKVS